MARIMYKEEQNYRKWDVLLFIGVMVVGLAYGAITGNATQVVQTSGISPLWFSSSLIILTLLLVYLLSIKYRLSVSNKGINFQYFPLHYKKQKIRTDEIQELKVVENSLLNSYNGADINFAVQEKMYSVCGRKGIQIKLKNGKNIFLGSKNPTRLKEAIQNLNVK